MEVKLIILGVFTLQIVSCQSTAIGKVIKCAAQCNENCYGTGVRDCCNTECTDGCSGPDNIHCMACKNFRNGNECVQSCPPPKIYDTKRYEYVRNPNAKFSYGSLCVSQCPGNFLQHRSACVKICPQGYTDKNGKCERCTNCKKKNHCKGTKLHNGSVNYWLSSKNIKNFQNCTTVQGSLILNLLSFTDDKYENTTSIHHDQLEMLSSIEEITGYLQIHAVPKDLRDFWFLRNLKRILGHSTEKVGQKKHVALDIRTFSPNLKSLGFQSLQQVAGGEVFIGLNPGLCFADTVAWKTITQWGVLLWSNRPKYECVAKNMVCDPQCIGGCWGKGPNMCVNRRKSFTDKQVNPKSLGR